MHSWVNLYKKWMMSRHLERPTSRPNLYDSETNYENDIKLVSIFFIKYFAEIQYYYCLHESVTILGIIWSRDLGEILNRASAVPTTLTRPCAMSLFLCVLNWKFIPGVSDVRMWKKFQTYTTMQFYIISKERFQRFFDRRKSCKNKYFRSKTDEKMKIFWERKKKK